MATERLWNSLPMELTAVSLMSGESMLMLFTIKIQSLGMMNTSGITYGEQRLGEQDQETIMSMSLIGAVPASLHCLPQSFTN